MILLPTNSSAFFVAGVSHSLWRPTDGLFSATLSADDATATVTVGLLPAIFRPRAAS